MFLSYMTAIPSTGAQESPCRHPPKLILFQSDRAANPNTWAKGTKLAASLMLWLDRIGSSQLQSPSLFETELSSCIKRKIIRGL